MKAKDLGKKVFEALKELHKTLTDKYKDGTTAGEVMGKYTGTEAIEQIDKCLKTFCEKVALEHKWPEAAAASMEGMMDANPEMAEMMEAMENMDGMAAGDGAEGGAEEMAAAEGAAAADGMAAGEGDMAGGAAPTGSKLFDTSAFGAISGAVDLPQLLVQLMIEFPAFSDAVKHQVMHHDLGGDAPFNSFGPVAALAGAYVAAKQEGTHESWGSSWLCKEDLEELKEVAKDGDNKALVFPGVVKAYTSEALAKGDAGEGVKDKTHVLFKFNGKAFQPAGPNMNVFFRHFAKVEKLTEPAGDVKHYVCELSDFTKYAFATLKEYADGIAAAVEAGKKAVDAAKGTDPAPAMDPPAMDPPAMDMDGMMAEAPAMDPPAAEEGS